MDIVEEELSTSDDEGSESPTSPSRSSHSTLDEGEMFHSTSALSSTGANGERATVTRPCTCTRSFEPGMCSICQQTFSLSSNTDEPVPDDAKRIVSTDGNTDELVPDDAERIIFADGNTDDPVPDDAERIVSADGNNQDDSKDPRVVMFQCTPCLEFFETEESFRDHVCAFRTGMFRPHCPVCYTQFNEGLLLQKHLEGLQSFSCQFCLTRCCSDEMLLDHLFSHPTCGKCGKSFADDLALCAVRIFLSHDHFIDKHCHSLTLTIRQHVESDHPVVVCWDCDGIVIDKNSLELHYADLASAHPTCASCGVGTRNLADMVEVCAIAMP